MALTRRQSRMQRLEARWLRLPEDLLLRVLALMDQQELMTVRLVCRDWRQAALTFATHLNLNNWLLNTADLRGSTEPHDMLTNCLRSLPNVSHLAYRITSPADAFLLSVSSSGSMKDLYIDFISLDDSHISEAWCDQPSDFVAHKMGPIANMTGLTFFGAAAPSRYCAQLFQALKGQFISSSIQIMQQCTGLCTVMVRCGKKSDWGMLLPKLAGLPHLSALGHVPIWDEEVGARVASITQLTHVRCTSCFIAKDARDDGGRFGMQCLLALPALRAVDLHWKWDRIASAMCEAMHGLTRLEQLGLELNTSERELPRILESILPPLSRLTKLEVLECCSYPLVLPQHLFQSSLANLQHLVWEASGLIHGTLAFPSSLRHLALDFDPLEDLAYEDPPSWELSTAVAEMFQSVAGLTRLTALSLSMCGVRRGWTSDDAANASWREATFLTGLTGLVQLYLNDVLHVGNVEKDVQCLAVLTALRSLGLRDNCCGWLDGTESDAEVEAAHADWMVAERWFQVLEARGVFLPLLSLAGVKELSVYGPWKALKGSSFATAFNAVRSNLARPPLNFDKRRVY